jgi:hypothetical protein
VNVSYYHCCYIQCCPFDHHVYMPDDERKVCPHPGCNEVRTQKRQILLLSLRSRLRRLFNNPKLAKLFQYPHTRTPGDGDIWDAEVMKNRGYAEGKNVIELVLSSDAAVYESWTKHSFTPVVVQNMNWPPAVRKCFGGLWLLAVFPPKVLYNSIYMGVCVCMNM